MAQITADLAADPTMTWSAIGDKMVTFLTNAAVNAAVPGLGAQITQFAIAMNSQKEQMWYFEMYGTGDQSFLTKYKHYARGSGASARVIA